MIRLEFIWRNLWRNKTRTALTIASFATFMFLLTSLHAIVSSISEVGQRAQKELRLVVHHKSTMTKLLPLSQVPKIAALPGVRAVCPVRWFGGRIVDSTEQFPSLAADVDAMPVIYSDFELSPEEVGQWRSMRSAAVVGFELARRMHWARGQRVSLRSTIPPYAQLEFQVVAITSAPAYPNLFGFRLDYLIEALKQFKNVPAELRDAAHFIWVKAESPSALNSIGPEIDSLFVNSLNPTVTEPEEAFITQFTMMFGNIPAILRGIGLILVLSIALVAGSTLSISLRGRLGELSVLRAIGFSWRKMFAALCAESMLIGLMGAVGGGVLLALCPGTMLLASAGVPYLPPMELSWSLMGWAMLVGMLLGLCAAILPVLRVTRVPVTQTLRALEA